jgi:hypothetical protein
VRGSKSSGRGLSASVFVQVEVLRVGGDGTGVGSSRVCVGEDARWDVVLVVVAVVVVGRVFGWVDVER